jgi:prevent-host-death family protein
VSGSWVGHFLDVLWHMRKTSVRELHIHTSELVREAEQGGVILIERRGEPVAELRPVSAPAPMPASKKARIFAGMQEIWGRMPQVGDSTHMIEDDRDR